MTDDSRLRTSGAVDPPGSRGHNSRKSRGHYSSRRLKRKPTCPARRPGWGVGVRDLHPGSATLKCRLNRSHAASAYPRTPRSRTGPRLRAPDGRKRLSVRRLSGSAVFALFDGRRDACIPELEHLDGAHHPALDAEQVGVVLTPASALNDPESDGRAGLSSAGSARPTPVCNAWRSTGWRVRAEPG